VGVAVVSTSAKKRALLNQARRLAAEGRLAVAILENLRRRPDDKSKGR